MRTRSATVGDHRNDEQHHAWGHGVEPNQRTDGTLGEWGQAQHAYPPASPPPRYYAAPRPMHVPTPRRTTPRRTWLGRWGLGCSIGALVMPVMAAVVARTGGVHAVAAASLLSLVMCVFAVLGVVFSAMGMRSCYAGRGLAIAGLTVGLVALVPVVLGVAAGVFAFSVGSHG